ncbi:Rne/Rng family ribonuclease [Peribacillus sp. YIM B13472]|uniref:Rne/Rng family ribonuclease n=1 Tax=Peribacillus TaxID=2675229 RepID=UPI0024C15634|nr:Rne/Rng family ribonuclease [Peribacillus simplex]MDR4925364.1 Rne/Rng family ribonuclease [Peribacillus simplex]WHX93861.1 Rne/Rng family ribonuclease [Peribacillus simplex]
MKKMIANLASREKRVAVLENGVLRKLEIMPPQKRSTVGNIYLGKVTKVLPGMDAVFIDYGAEKNGFLHRDEVPSFQLTKKSDGKASIGQFVHQGEKLLVQVTRDETGTKGAKLTGLIEFSTNSLVYIHGIDYVGVSKKFKNDDLQKQWRETALQYKNPDEGLIVRTSMENESESVFLDRLTGLRELYKELEGKAASLKAPSILYERDAYLDMIISEMSGTATGELAIDDFEAYRELKKWIQENRKEWEISHVSGPKNIFSEWNVEAQVEKMAKKIVWLENGGYLIFEETEAFTVIDVNSGKFTGKVAKEATLFAVNQAAAKEVARQLRLRNISGIILIDFINMDNSRHEQEIIDIVKKEAVRDEKRIQVIGFTELGILQMTRKRTSPSLSEMMSVPCPVCSGSGKIESPETVAFRLERELLEHRKTDDEAVWVEVSKAVADVLLGEKESYRPTLEELIAKKIFLSFIPGSRNVYSIKRFGSIQEIGRAFE